MVRVSISFPSDSLIYVLITLMYGHVRISNDDISSSYKVADEVERLPAHNAM